ncbi:hypothetical protein HIM_04313 [Hirsutella minnesotensis 3608]|uniref:Glutamate--tRNA ligase, mitochondrial n=1 Tax=Hirsutella minnesotensis 3608 TaxID=1043627 RepID=A0A0F7ZLC0_9HYPO|nr:hypothetical protein HIM_04313 [Hirsutella minnesotensis 3608]
MKYFDTSSAVPPRLDLPHSAALHHGANSLDEVSACIMSILAHSPQLARRLGCLSNLNGSLASKCVSRSTVNRQSSHLIRLLHLNGGGTTAAPDKDKTIATTVSPNTNLPGEPGSGLKGLRSIRGSRQQQKSHELTHTIFGQSANLPIRTRFAPSPTGYLHLGSLRTALFNNVVSRASKGGAFILRIEDTDQNRRVQDAEERIVEDLKWAGLSWEEGPDCGGPHGPYRQSQRLPIYKEHVERLLEAGHAYRCFCTSEQLDSQKRRLHDAGLPTVYAGTCRSINKVESQRRAAEGEPHVVRFRGDVFGSPKFRDAIYGPFQKKNPEEDFVLLKTDGFPTYHLANVVDDHLMQITHVIRGEEWLISTPKHIALYEAFGWKPPTFAHLGLLINPDGTKLSKRNDSVNLSRYQQQGIFPMALLSWLANLGSSFKAKTKTPRSLQDIVDVMTYKFTTGGIKLNFPKLDYFQSKYRDTILGNPIPELAEREAHLILHHLTLPLLREIDTLTNRGDPPNTQLPERWQTPLDLVPALRSDDTRKDYITRIFAVTQGNFQSLEGLVKQHPYLFWRVPTALYTLSVAAAATAPDAAILDALEQTIEQPYVWDGQGSRAMEYLRDALQGSAIDPVAFHNTLRLVATGAQDLASQTSARMFAILGRDEWRHRLAALRAACDGSK